MKFAQLSIYPGYRFVVGVVSRSDFVVRIPCAVADLFVS